MSDGAPGGGGPTLEAQVRFWDEWNVAKLAAAERNSLQLEQRDWVRRVAGRLAVPMGEDRPLRILDLGCGTGWLGAALTDFGEVTGIDLSPAAVEHGRREFPGVRFLAGDFSDASIVGPFDLVISSEVMAHVADQRAYVERVAELLRAGGTFLLMTQNGFVWRRWSWLRPTSNGMIRDWPRLSDLRKLLPASGLPIVRISSLEPSGDRGVLRVVNSRVLRGAFKLVGLKPFWHAARNRILVGRDFAIEARRR